MHNLIVDIKGELRDITASSNDIIVDISDRSTYGLDPFFLIKEAASVDEMVDGINLICNSLIPPPPGETNPFWADSSRSMLFGCLLYFYKEEGMRSLPDMIQRVLGQPINKLVDEIIEGSIPQSPEYMSIIAYKDMASETLISIYNNLKLAIFPLVQDSSLVWILGTNPRKYTPDMLLEHDVYLVVPQHKLQDYSQFVLLALNQFFSWALRLPEHRIAPARSWIGVVIDEAPALMSHGKISELPMFLKVCRSRGIAPVILCTQSLAALRVIFKDEELRDMMSNLPFQIYLDAGTVYDSELIAKQIGQYQSRTTSYTGGGKEKKTTVSFQDKELVTLRDLRALPNEDDLIMITPYGYNKIKKCYYFLDKYFKNLQRRIKGDDNYESRK